MFRSLTLLATLAFLSNSELEFWMKVNDTEIMDLSLDENAIAQLNQTYKFQVSISSCPKVQACRDSYVIDFDSFYYWCYVFLFTEVCLGMLIGVTANTCYATLHFCFCCCCRRCRRQRRVGEFRGPDTVEQDIKNLWDPLQMNRKKEVLIFFQQNLLTGLSNT